jgi:molybdate transport system substrate-binding protein
MQVSESCFFQWFRRNLILEIRTRAGRIRWGFLRVWLAAALALVILPPVSPAEPGGPQTQKQDLTISAAISLKEALDEIQIPFQTYHPDTTLHFNLSGSGTLQRQIEQGAPVDVFISASPKEMDSLEAKGLILAGTRRDLAKNRVVLVVPSGESGIKSFQDLTRAEIKFIAVGEPQTVPAGKYAQEVLTHFGIYDDLKSKLVLAKDVRQVLTYVATGNADAGIVYATDAQTTTRVKVAAIAPEESHSPVIYPAAVIKSSKNPSAAKEFIEFLLGARARAVFDKYGFTPAGSGAAGPASKSAAGRAVMQWDGGSRKAGSGPLVLLEHDFRGLDDGGDRVPYFEIHLFGALARNDTVDQILANSDGDVRHHVP